jgi:hypothetical protein
MLGRLGVEIQRLCRVRPAGTKRLDVKIAEEVGIGPDAVGMNECLDGVLV